MRSTCQRNVGTGRITVLLTRVETIFMQKPSTAFYIRAVHYNLVDIARLPSGLFQDARQYHLHGMSVCSFTRKTNITSTRKPFFAVTPGIELGIDVTIMSMNLGNGSFNRSNQHCHTGVSEQKFVGAARCRITTISGHDKYLSTRTASHQIGSCLQSVCSCPQTGTHIETPYLVVQPQ